MDEERFQEYSNLIQQLLQCPNGQEGEILQANPELVNQELVQIMAAVAAQMEEDGDNNANWLRSLAQHLAEILKTSWTQVISEDYLNFLESILEAVVTDHSPQSVYPLLEQNLDKLDENLGQILQFWARENLSQLQP
ncbi:hypothetical protein [Moorena bouillonii]|uniref:Uncharacterized protein n=1 Tax=Moorena bouillonii PNG TaxID=568701 RepID=A0A1U7NA99_9CYAN|nr:hypothetical protein [Moorena bouillonii]OLT62877.1 hypothetical protein BJP37_31415 [Moorena bouillonii PNG]